MRTSTSPDINLTQEEFLDLTLLDVLAQGNQLAMWKKPDDPMLHILIDKTQKIKRVALDLGNLPPGFIVHPFADQVDKKAYFLEADEHITIDLNQETLHATQLPLGATLRYEETDLKTRIKEELDHQSADRPGGEEISSTLKEDFMEQVTLGIEAIRQGELSKIVPVKRKVVTIKKGFDLSATFLRLFKAYPNAFVNFFHLPRLGTWIGASPEVLIKTHGNQFSTMALAGSQKAVGDNPLKNVAWTQKEIEEQALVGRYIVGCFKKIRLREYEEIGPKTAIAGSLLHLRTDFKVDMKATGFPELGAMMLQLLHPTSAVAGMPRDKALEFIKRHERFDRSLFSGYLGPVNIEEETAIFVNLRSARLLAEHAILYAGAGVTEDSIPEKEWDETEYKCDIIGRFIQKH